MVTTSSIQIHMAVCLNFDGRAEESGRSMLVVKRVVEAHRGRVEIESAVGQGTRVLLRLPIVIP
ncbi:ATP-binding protein [Thermoflexus hugenholtzii]